MPELKRYIANQKEHHRKQTFQEELIQFLEGMESNTISGISGIRCDPDRVELFVLSSGGGAALAPGY